MRTRKKVVPKPEAPPEPVYEVRICRLCERPTAHCSFCYVHKDGFLSSPENRYFCHTDITSDELYERMVQRYADRVSGKVPPIAEMISKLHDKMGGSPETWCIRTTLGLCVVKDAPQPEKGQEPPMFTNPTMLCATSALQGQFLGRLSISLCPYCLLSMLGQ